MTSAFGKLLWKLRGCEGISSKDERYLKMEVKEASLAMSNQAEKIKPRLSSPYPLTKNGNILIPIFSFAIFWYNKTSMKFKIAVAGASQTGHYPKNIETLAKEIGREISCQNCILITGATTGVPYFAAKGTKEAKGISIGFSPASSELEHKKIYKLPLDYFDVIVYTGFGYSGRNLLMTRAADGVVIVCGRMGTLNEFTIAFEDRKPIGVLVGSGGTADIIKEITKTPHRRGEKIVYDSNPKRLIKKLIKLIKKKKRDLK